jgi:hypothetical protein
MVEEGNKPMPVFPEVVIIVLVDFIYSMLALLLALHGHSAMEILINSLTVDASRTGSWLMSAVITILFVGSSAWKICSIWADERHSVTENWLP